MEQMSTEQLRSGIDRYERHWKSGEKQRNSLPKPSGGVERPWTEVHRKSVGKAGKGIDPAMYADKSFASAKKSLTLRGEGLAKHSLATAKRRNAKQRNCTEPRVAAADMQRVA